jgi:superfamily II DNA or RNA helicase
MSQESRGLFPPGEVIRVRGDTWEVVQQTPFEDCTMLALAGVTRSNLGVRRTVLHPFDRPVVTARARHPRVVGRRRWLRAFQALAGLAVPYGGLRAAPFANFDLLPYQLEPALACVRGLSSRLLLADEVGLGKTVQAGLLLAELTCRGKAAHTLILTPAGLRDQWAQELADRFSITASVADAAWLRRVVASLPAGVNPWATTPVAIASFDFVKRPEVLRALDSLVWDLLIVDEAHLTPTAKERGGAVRALAARARRVALVTATPHAGDPEAFAALAETGRLERGDRIWIFRRSRQDAGLASDRRVRLLAVRPSPDERQMHDRLAAYTARVWHESQAADARLAMIVLRKRALSSAGSLGRSIRRRLEWLPGGDAEAGAQLALPFPSVDDEEDDDRDREPVNALSAPGLDDAGHERRWLVEILEAAERASASESKLRVLVRLLTRLNEPAIVFTEYRDTAARLADALAPLMPVAVLHGGLNRQERLAVEAAFRSGTARVLVATDAAGEGLNLHARCRLVVNAELPWNPMRLEQRIGRVDRIGQRRRVHAVHLFARDTCEASVLGRLVARLERARASLGRMNDPLGLAGEEQVAEAIFAGETRPICRPWPNGPRADAPPHPPAALIVADLRAEARAEAARLEHVRRLTASAAEGPPLAGGAIADVALELDSTGPWLARFRPSVVRSQLACCRGSLGALRPGVTVCLVRAVATDGLGDVLEEVVLPVCLPLDLRHLSNRDTRRAVESLSALARTALERRLSPQVAARLSEVARAHAVVSERDERRETAIWRWTAATRGRAAGEQVQAGLFDRRALRQAELLRAAWAGSEAEAVDRLRVLEASAQVTLVPLHLALALAIT